MNNAILNHINLLEYQTIHYSNIKKSIINHSRALDASDTGTGKTFVSVKLCNELGLIPWVICPKSVVSSWHRVIKQGGIKKFYIITYEQLMLSTNLIEKTSLNDSNEYDWKFESNSIFKDKQKEKYLFIYDEAHKCKNIKTINSKILVSLSKYPVKILLLSATIIDKPLYFIPFGMVLGFYKNVQEGIDWMSGIINTNSKSTNPMLPIHKILFPQYASRMRIDDTVDVFKDNKIIFEGIDMKNYWEIEKKYDKINKILEYNKENKKSLNIKKTKSTKSTHSNKDIDNSDSDKNSNSDKNSDAEIDLNKDINYRNETDINNGKYDEIETETNKTGTKKNNGIGRIQKIRQEIELLRIDTIYEMTLKYINKGKSVAIFVNFTETIKQLASRLNSNCIIWGSQSLKERSKAIDDFCSDKSRIIICNTMSAGTGISLHDTLGQFPRVSVISPTWSAQDLIQVLGRIHRAMGKTDCEQLIMFCKGTIEESIGNVIKQKINNIRMFNDGEKKLKKDNMEVILNNELIKKKKKKEKNEYIYITKDFDSIQSRIDWFERELKILNEELEKYKLNSQEYAECKYRIEKVQKEMDYNLKKLNDTIENMCLE
jgi:superfamily II DNA or RNA helicase